MFRQLFGVGLFCAAAIVGCSNAPHEPGTTDGTNVSDVGTVNLPLTTETNGVTYRLSAATFTITGSALAKPLVIKPAPDTPVDTETLPVGSYAIVLADGWVLERKGAEADATFKAVKASLITPNPASFTTAQGIAADVLFGFATPGGDVSLRRGDVNVRIGVQDCSEFDGYASAIASFTVDCLGTIDQNSFTVTPDGLLARNFDKCTQNALNTDAASAAAAGAAKLASIDAYLSLQVRTVRLPFAKACIAGRWADWKLTFDQSGAQACPLWTKTSTIGTPTPDVIDRLIPQLAKLPAKDDGTRPAFLGQMKESYLYTVAFAANTPPQKGCDTPGACAQLCAGGFPGFVLRTDGQTVLTDPPYWLLDTTFSGTGTDPFLKAGYYHPMSYYGPLPGTQFAHRNRAAPCPGCVAETCSYFAGIHVKLPLQMDCLNASDPSTCVGYCAP